jgi:hypothetical protein
MKKEAQVIMLPAEREDSNKAPLGKFFDTGGLVFRVDSDIPRGAGQHLYIVDDSEIKDGDWFIFKNNLYKCNSTDEDLVYFYNQEQDEIERYINDCKKIIATTDPKLINQNGNMMYKSDECDAAQPSQQFIKEYCEKGGIDKVMVGYERLPLDKMTILSGNPYYEPQYELKINPDNTINIFPIKESWSREEVEKLLKGLYASFAAYPIMNLDLRDNWIKQNL